MAATCLKNFGMGPKKAGEGSGAEKKQLEKHFEIN